MTSERERDISNEEKLLRLLTFNFLHQPTIHNFLLDSTERHFFWLGIELLFSYYFLICYNKNFVQLGFSVSNWQKVQLNTDLFSETQKYLYTEKSA